MFGILLRCRLRVASSFSSTCSGAAQAQEPYIKTEITVKPRFTGPLGGKELGPVNREARYIGVHFALIYT